MNQCPSITAWRVARHRARHQTLENGRIFQDPLAIPILGPDAAPLLADDDTPGDTGLRQFIAIRSRIAEDKLADAVAHGARQAVILGGGLDTLGLRDPHREAGLRIFEIDRPVMQAWKRTYLQRISLSPPASLTFVPVDFEADHLEACLIDAGFDPTQPAFVSWLGVIPYLTRPGIEATLRFISTLPHADIVFDYGEPIENYTGHMRTIMEGRSQFVAAQGEPWISRFTQAQMADLLADAHLSKVTDLDRHAIAAYFGWPNPPARPQGSPHVVHAQTYS